MSSVPLRRPILLIVVPLLIGCTRDSEPVTGQPELQGHTVDYEQSETAVAIKDMGAGQQVITIAYNDLTQNPNDPKIEYPDGLDMPARTIHRGASLMGWSLSIDDGSSYIYGGRVEPPAGWSFIWSDPALTTGPTMITDQGELKLVYMAQLAGSDLKFPPDGEIVNLSPGAFLDGFCVAMSVNGGLTFPNARCFKHGICEGSVDTECDHDSFCGLGCNGVFYDGTALTNLNDTIYFASFNFKTKAHEVWRARAGTLDFERMSNNPFGDWNMVAHPRLRAFNGRVYILGQRQQDGFPVMTFLEDGSDVWADPKIVGNPAVIQPDVLLSDRKIRAGNQFSFDVAFQNNELREVRVLYTRIAPNGKLFLEATTCNADLLPSGPNPLVAQCAQPPGWSTENSPGDQFNPVLKVAGGSFVDDADAVWQGVWLSRRDDPNGNVLSVNRGKLQSLPNGGPAILLSLDLIEPQVPCSRTSDGYWGDYNDLGVLVYATSAGGPQFVAPFTDNRGSVDPTPCAYRGPRTIDVHVSAVVFQ